MKVVDWSNLQEELADMIFKKLRHAGDVIRFEAVCTSWNRVSSEGRRRPLKLLSPVLLFPFPADNGFWGILDHSTKKIGELRFSETRKCCGSCCGWLVFQNCDLPLNIKFINPMTGRQVQLPEIQEGVDIHKVRASSSPSDPNCMVMAIYRDSTKRQNLAFCIPNDGRWKILTDQHYRDIVYYKKKFYALNYSGVLHKCKINDNIGVMEIARDRLYGRYFYRQYLVEMSGNLLQIVKKLGLKKEYSIRKMEFKRRKWIKVKSLRKNALFFGKYQSFGVSTEEFCEFTADSLYIQGEPYLPVPTGPNVVEVYNVKNSETKIHSSMPCMTRRSIWIAPDLSIPGVLNPTP